MSRECGDRQEGGIYVEVGTSPNGKPLEHFLFDPPVPVPDALTLSPRGMQVVQTKANGPFHLVDVVGQDHYPNVWDVLEEGRALGFSRRVQKTLDFSKITEESRIILVHPRGYIVNFEEFYDILGLQPHERGAGPVWPYCPRQLPKHNEYGRPFGLARNAAGQEIDERVPEMCAGLWSFDLVEGTEVTTGDFGGQIAVKRVMKELQYFGGARPKGFTPVYKRAFIASFPISRLVVVKAEMERHAEALRKAQAAKIEVTEVEK
jgi:hypothetical protein